MKQTSRQNPEQPGPPPNEPSTDLQRLRELLLAPERARIERLERTDHHLSPDEVAQILPEAVLQRSREDSALTTALSPVVESSLRESIRRDPQSLVDAIFPIMGPAIRRSIQASLRGIVDNLNRTTEQSLSAQGLRWRLEAWRTKRPFAEVVLSHSLLFRVEQAFLIHRESGVLLDDASAPGAAGRDPELVSAMLSALQSFVSDSFQGGGLERLDFDDHTLLITQGPLAVLAAVVQGTTPVDFATRMAETIEHYHQHLGEQLTQFEGDPSPFELQHAQLEELLVETVRERKRSAANRVMLPLAAGLIGIALVAWGLNSVRQRRDFKTVVDGLTAAPGLQVVLAEYSGRAIDVRGLRDPDAAPAEEVLEALGIDPSRVASAWEPFLSQAPSVVLQRARRRLAPPDTVRLGLEAGVLTAAGSAPHAWVRRARAQAPFLAGIDAYDESQLLNPELERLEAALRSLETAVVRFNPDTADVALEAELRAVRDRLVTAEDAARPLEVRVELTVRGRTTPEDTGAGNLSLPRARSIADALAATARSGVTWIAVSAAPPAAKGAVATSASSGVQIRARWRAEQP